MKYLRNRSDFTEILSLEEILLLQKVIISLINKSNCLSCFNHLPAEGGCPDTTFIEDAVHELLKTRRILKCSYPYGFFLEPKSTKKEIFELMQVKMHFWPSTSFNFVQFTSCVY